MNWSWQRKTRTAILVFALLGAGTLLSLRAGWVGAPIRAVFTLFLCLLLCPSLFWWLWLDDRLRAGRAGRGRRAARAGIALYLLIMLTPVAVMLAGVRFDRLIPVPLLMWVMGWHLWLLALGLVGLGMWPICHVARTARRLAVGSTLAPDDCDEPRGIRTTRRSLMTGALLSAPMVLAGGTAIGGLRQQGRFRVRRIEMQLPRLPSRLDGLTITQLSDLHLGRLFRPEHLPRVIDAANELHSDLVAITGDVVDHSADYLPIACDAFAGLENRYGRFVVIGNHDLIDSPGAAVDYLKRHEARFLSDQVTSLQVGGERIQIAGLFWSRYEWPYMGIPGHEQRAARTLAMADREVFTLGLAHHPHAFDTLADHGVDLTLAGHTHGGQLMLTPPGSPNPIGGGNLLFRYIWGEYRRGNSLLYVNSGIGNWFPVRLNAPAEIVQIRLRATA